MPNIGDLRAVEYDPEEFEIELYALHRSPTLWVIEPFWALPNWLDMGFSEFVGPFSTYKEAAIQIRVFRNNKDKRLQKYLE